MATSEEMKKSKFKEVKTILDAQSDELVFVLRMHLIIEQCIEDLLRLLVKRSDYLLDSREVHFNHKIVYLQALDFLDHKYIESIKKLNKLRNNYSHKTGYKISKSDVDAIGIPLGKAYTKIRKMHDGNEYKKLTGVLYYLAGYLHAAVYNLEEKSLENETAD